MSYLEKNKQEGGSHYKDFDKLGFCEGNVIKYVCRHKRKNGIEDLRKAKHYLEILAEIKYGEKI